MKKQRLTITALRTDSPWEIAQRLGIQYTGDLCPIPHGGTFYETKEWVSFGYAGFVRFQESEGVLYLETGTVNRPNFLGHALDFVGWDVAKQGPPPIGVEVEACLSYGYYDADECQTFRSDNGKDWGDFPEFQIMRAAKPLILSLAE